MKTNEIHLQDLLKVKKGVWVRLEDDFRKKIFKKALNKTKSLLQLSHLIDEKFGTKSESTIYNWYKGKRNNQNYTKIIPHGIPLRVLKFLSDFTKIPMDEIEKHIDFIKGNSRAYKVFYPRFPIILNEATSAVISHVLHDGYLELGKLRVTYSNKDRENLEHFKKSVIEMFKASEVEFGEILDNDGGTRIDAPNIVGYVLVCFGLQPGNKLLIDVKIPDCLLKCGNGNVISIFLGSLVADEAYVENSKSQNGGYVSLQLNGMSSKNPPKLLIHDKIMFNKIGIRTTDIQLNKEKETKGGEKRYVWSFGVYGQRDLINLQKKVKIPLIRKQRLLDEAIDSYICIRDAIVMKDSFRLKLFRDGLKKFDNSIKNLSKSLTIILNRNISRGSINDWRKGRYHCPIDVVICLAKLNNIDIECILENIESYKPNKKFILLKEGNLKNLFSELWPKINL